MQIIVAKFDAKRQGMPKCVWKDEDSTRDGEGHSVSEWKQRQIEILITENSIPNCRIQNLCFSWENALSHGLKTTSLFQNIVSGNLTAESTAPTFWDFAYQHLTGHEKERFSTLRYG